MWVYKFINKETRTQVPTLWTFLRTNHESIKMWLENTTEPVGFRIHFALRVIRWLTSLCILFLFVYALINPQGRYYKQECSKRLECYNACNKAFFPQLSCENQEHMDFYFKWNHYSDMYLFSRPAPEDFGVMPLAGKDLSSWQSALRDYETCKSYILDFKDYPMALAEPKRQIRTHSCFSYCRNGEDPNFMGDDRPDCIELQPQERDRLICLYPEDRCESTSVSNPWILGTMMFTNPNTQEQTQGTLLFAPEAGLIAMILANPCQLLWDFMTIYLRYVKVDKDNAKVSCLFLSYQVFIAFMFLFILFFSIHLAIQTVETGDSFLVFVTFALIYIIDQIKQLGTLSVVYIVVVRRFGYLKQNEKEFVEAESREAKYENAIPRLKNCCLKTLEHQYIERLSLLTIGLYSIFILFDLTMSALFEIDPDMLETIDFVFLTVFLIEIVLKTFASSGTFFVDSFNLFDATIVIVSWALMIRGITFKGLGVLRLIRVVVITMRSITGNKSRLRHQSKQNNPVDSVIQILIQLQDLPVSQSIRREAQFAAQIIEDNRLYDLSLEQNGEGSQDMEAKAWLNITTEQANDTTQWFERDLDDFLKELHRDDCEVDQNQVEEDEERLRQIVEVNARQWTNILKIMDDFDKWEFDIFEYCSTLGDNFLLHFSFRLFQMYGLLDKFSIADQNLVSLVNSIKNATYEQNSYHNLTKVVELTRNFHYFTKQGNLMQHFSDLNIMSAFLACLLCDIQHPGVNNPFLIAMRHVKAIRYNDKSVLENHHCAIAFKLLLDPQNDVFELLSEAQYWNVRQIIIKMILSSDLSNHFEQMMTFKSRIASKKFPEDTMDDKQLIMNVVLQCSDHAGPTKVASLYFRWMAQEMEEYYQQGDLERKLDFSVTPFFDRATCNPFKYQLGYIDVIALPLFETWCDFKSSFRDTLISEGVEPNRRLLVQKVDETKFLADEKQQNTNAQVAHTSQLVETPSQMANLVIPGDGSDRPRDTLSPGREEQNSKLTNQSGKGNQVADAAGIVESQGSASGNDGQVRGSKSKRSKKTRDQDAQPKK